MGRDKHTKFTFCHLVKQKGTGDEQVIEKVLKSLSETGNTRMILKTDGEIAIVQLQEEIAKKRQHETLMDNPLTYDPQANGDAERAVQESKLKCERSSWGSKHELVKRSNPRCL